MKFYIGEDDSCYYVFNENGDCLEQLPKEDFKSISKVKKYVRNKVNKIGKEIINTCINVNNLIKGEENDL